MAEAIAVGASVIAIIQIADRIIGLCKFYIETAQDAPSDLRAILVETSALKTILENLNFLTACDGPDSAAARRTSGADGPIEGCFRTVTELEKLFPSDSVRTRGRKNSKKRTLKSVLTALAWPLKESKARKLLDEMMRYKTTISLALTTNSIQDIQEIKKKASKIQNMLTESQRREVYQWLQHTDPSPLHHRAQKDYETGTGNWILRSPEWADWLAGTHRCLWIHGIPGAGKTILMSYLIEQIGKFCARSSHRRSVYVYYYCHFAHNQDETKPFLKWVISRLCREAGHIPTYVYNLSKHGAEPSLTALLEAVAQILVSFDTVYIAVDALDESRSRDDLLQILRTLVTDLRFKGLQLVTSSREYIDIERTMASLSVSISMNNPFVEQDIRYHVHANLQSNPRFGNWPPDLLYEVEESITTGAGGMFRWAVCQIDSLQRLKCERKTIQKAIKNLPKTLYETYDRIFLAVPEEERLFVEHALRWIVYHNELYDGQEIPCDVLIQATEASMLSLTGNQNERFYDKDTLREVCGCLIDISPEDHLDRHHRTYISVSLAHYSVREYLDSTHISNALFGYHTIRGGNLKDRFLEITLLEVQRIDLREPEIAITGTRDVKQAVASTFSIHCLKSALFSLYQFPGQICRHSTLTALAIDLLDPSMPHFPISIEMMKQTFGTHGSFFWTPEWYSETNTELKHLYNLLSLTEGSRECLPLVKTFLQGKDLKSLLQAQLHFKRDVWHSFSSEDDLMEYVFNGSLIEIFAQLAIWLVDAFNFLVEVGAGSFDPSTALLLYIGGHNHSFNRDDFCPLQLYIGRHNHPFNRDDFCPLQRLLELGADPNLRGYQVTPLQIATFTSDYEGVELLLKAGAMPNDTGSADGIIWQKGSILHGLSHLHGASPLHICRDFKIISRPTFRKIGADYRKKIEALLLYHGAEAFSTISGLDMQESRIEDDDGRLKD